jgi:1-acyl-sn-glycerol-3-phosphate acyltransferase
LVYGAARIKVEEDVSRFFPKDKKLEKINKVFQGSKFAEKLVVIVSMKDTSAVEPEALIRFGDSLINKIQKELQPFVKEITYRVDEESAFQIFDLINEHLPVFLNENDFTKLDSITSPETVSATLNRNYKQLISPTGLALKKIILHDPLGISKIVLTKLQRMQYDSDFELYDNYFLSKDHKNLIFFISPVYPSNDTGNNSKFLEKLNESINKVSNEDGAATATYFGGLAVAVGNANQLRDDTILTVSIMIILMVFFFFIFLRKKRAPLFILIPVLFGGLFSLALINLIQGSISVLAIASGSIVLGIALNYSLHFLSHLKETGNVRLVVKDLAHPLTLGGITTILAFLSLRYASASMLSDIGLFAGFSLIGAIICSLVFLPHLLSNDFFGFSKVQSPSKSNLYFLNASYSKYVVALIFAGTPLMLYFAKDVKFNSDMNKLNFMSPKLKKTEAKLNRVASFAAKSVYLVSDGKTLEQALQQNERIIPLIDSMRQQGVVKKINSSSSFILSDSLQKVRLSRWNSYWTRDKKEKIRKTVIEKFEALKFSDRARANFDLFLEKGFSIVSDSARQLLLHGFFGDYITERPGMTTVVTLASVDQNRLDSFYRGFENLKHTEPFDKRMLTNLFVSSVHADFTFIVTVTSMLVFIVLLISYGRIELTLITFIPMVITWIWILGVMALVGIEFNIVNVMISTFIFGLGDDYSIFIMDGLQKEYKTGHRHLSSIQDSIFLSALTTICGLGVLLFAKHPALQSVAAISVIGIVAVFIISQTIEPFLFSLLINRRVVRKFPPLTFLGVFLSILIYSIFIFGSLLLTVTGFVFFKVLRLNNVRTRSIYHGILQFFMIVMIYSGLPIRKRITNAKGQYQQPKIIISNHQSFIDILLTTMLHRKVLLLTNSWVWNSPIFGWVVKMADYYPVDAGAEGSIDKLQARVTEGYSIMVFPEGTRSSDGQIKRFHKGAFFLSEKLKLDILPLLIHGTGDSIIKGDLYIQTAEISMKFLPAIKYNDPQYGTSYSERAKNIGRFFKQEYAQFALEVETPKSFKHKLISNYLYKGPVLEWYLRIKLRLEDYYSVFHQLVPRNATVLDLGCGYGFLDYVLHFSSPQRKITGVDYDEEKIEVAAKGYLRGDNLAFVHDDIQRYSISNSDVIIIADALHYMDGESQEELLKKCFDKLNAGGLIIVKDGDSDVKEAHKVTKVTELFSVKLLNFNKSSQPLNFISGKWLSELTERHAMDLQLINNQKLTSNRIFVIRKRDPV